MVVLDSDYKLFRCISVAPNQIYDTGLQRVFDPKKMNIDSEKPEYFIDDYTFSQSGRYFVASDRKNLAIVDLEKFETFFDPNFLLEDKMNETNTQVLESHEGTEVVISWSFCSGPSDHPVFQFYLDRQHLTYCKKTFKGLYEHLK